MGVGFCELFLMFWGSCFVYSDLRICGFEGLWVCVYLRVCVCLCVCVVECDCVFVGLWVSVSRFQDFRGSRIQVFKVPDSFR